MRQVDTSADNRCAGWTRGLVLAAIALAGCSSEEIVAPMPPLHPLPAEPITRPQIAFVSNRDGREYVYVANADGSAVGRLALGSAPAWSWDGEKIAYVGESGAGIHVMDPDGSNQLRLTQGGGSPAWSPDGRITFEMFTESAGYGIFVMNADGTGVTGLIDAEADFPADSSACYDYIGDPVPCQPSVGAATWSPDGQTVAFTRSPGAGPLQLSLMDADGTHPRLLTESIRFMAPAFSPDGTTLAFEWGDIFRPDVCGGWPWIATASPNATDSSEFEVVCGPALGSPSSPGWSHHGTQLVFSQASRVGDSSSSPSPTQQRIYLVQLAGRRWQQLVPDAVDPRQEVYDDYAPTWAPVAR
jgi:Tol biopolymer transport system component